MITVGPVRPVLSCSWETFRAISTRGASITCTKREHKHTEHMTSCLILSAGVEMFKRVLFITLLHLKGIAV